MDTAGIDIRVAELLCSRLCHDLISPVGAVNNGVELIEEMGGDMGDEAMSLIAESAARAAARLRCYRLAYGAAGGRPALPVDEVRGAAIDFLEGGKARLDWPATGSAEIPAALGKTVLNLVVLASEALIHGGTIAVRQDGAGRAQVAAEGRTAELSAELAAALDGQAAVEALTPRTVHAYFVGCVARHHGLRLAHRQDAEGRLVIEAAS